MAPAPKNPAAPAADPTVTGKPEGDPYPEGNHPVRPASEVTSAAEKIEYRDAKNDEKPDPSSVVSVELGKDDDES